MDKPLTIPLEQFKKAEAKPAVNKAAEQAEVTRLNEAFFKADGHITVIPTNWENDK